jgi:chemotaxis protein methyltransferase CheR
LQRKVVEAMTTNETYFFREPAHFGALRTHVIPALMESRRTEQKLAFWSAAASSGQEAYSLAMLLCEMGLASWHIRIVGTDISSVILDRASAGAYNQVEIGRGLPAPLRVKYCTQRDDDTWEIKPALRRMTTFQLFDLRYNIRHLGRFDVVLCRNVLIYFDPATKSRIVDDIHSALHPDGCLFLGGSEISLPVGPAFRRVVVGDATFFKSTGCPRPRTATFSLHAKMTVCESFPMVFTLLVD